MQTAWQAIADGPGGVAQILAQLTAQKDYFGSLPCIRAAALVIARPTADNDAAGNAAALATFVRSALCYVTDPVNSELTQTPDALLLAIDRDGKAFGDCDDHVLLFSALCESLGIACDIGAVKTPGANSFDHVIALPWIGGVQTQVDLCAKFGAVAPDYADIMTASGAGAVDAFSFV